MKTDKTTEIIASTDNTATGQVLSLKNCLPEQQSAITTKAPALVDTFVADQNALLDFGTSAVGKSTQQLITSWPSKRN